MRYVLAIVLVVCLSGCGWLGSKPGSQETKKSDVAKAATADRNLTVTPPDPSAGVPVDMTTVSMKDGTLSTDGRNAITFGSKSTEKSREKETSYVMSTLSQPRFRALGIFGIVLMIAGAILFYLRFTTAGVIAALLGLTMIGIMFFPWIALIAALAALAGAAFYVVDKKKITSLTDAKDVTLGAIVRAIDGMGDLMRKAELKKQITVEAGKDAEVVKDVVTEAKRCQ